MTRLSELPGAKWTKTRVQSYAGVRGVREPRSFDLASQRLDVLEILDRWSSPDHHYFKVRVKGAKFYVLRHTGAGDEWEITLFHL